jgi:hypothetical protein
VPVVGVFSDYNLTLPYLAGLWPFFDVLLCDRGGQDLFTRLGFADVRYWCQYAHKRPFHRLWPDAGPRTIDVGFAGNLNPTVQRERAPWIRTRAALGDRGVQPRCAPASRRRLRPLPQPLPARLEPQHPRRDEPARLRGAGLRRRAADGAREPRGRGLLRARRRMRALRRRRLRGRGRRTARRRTTPRRIAAAGHRRVQQHRLGNRLHQLAKNCCAQRRPAPGSTEAERILGRAIAMLPTWADGKTIAAAALAAHDLAPDDPRTLNLLGLATLRWRGGEGGAAAWRLWQRAVDLADPVRARRRPTSPPSPPQRRPPAAAGGAPNCWTRARRHRLGRPRRPTLPLGFADVAIDRSLALQAAVRADQPSVLAANCSLSTTWAKLRLGREQPVRRRAEVARRLS